MDEQGLFGAGAEAAQEQGNKAGSQKKGPRTVLYNWDTTASTLFNPYGKSVLSSLSPASLWGAISHGTKHAKFTSELASPDEARVGIGLSRTAETLIVAIEHLDDTNIKKLLNEEALAKAKTESDALLPHLRILNAGKTSAGDAAGINFAQIKKRRLNCAKEPEHKEEDVMKAAEAVHAWLAKPQSPLRALLHILSCDGAMYAAATAEKSARAWVHHKPADEKACVTAALARFAKGPLPAPAAGALDTEGLL